MHDAGVVAGRLPPAAVGRHELRLGSALGATTTAAAHAVAGRTGASALGAAFAALGLLAWTLGVPALRAARRSRRRVVTVGQVGLEPTTDGL